MGCPLDNVELDDESVGEDLVESLAAETVFPLQLAGDAEVLVGDRYRARLEMVTTEHEAWQIASVVFQYAKKLEKCKFIEHHALIEEEHVDCAYFMLKVFAFDWKPDFVGGRLGVVVVVTDMPLLRLLTTPCGKENLIIGNTCRPVFAFPLIGLFASGLVGSVIGV